MKYTYEFTWEAVYKFVPEYKAMREQGVPTSLPEALNHAAIRVFMIQNQYPEEYNKDKYAFEIIVIYDALKELKEHGHIKYGDKNSF